VSARTWQEDDSHGQGCAMFANNNGWTDADMHESDGTGRLHLTRLAIDRAEGKA